MRLTELCFVTSAKSRAALLKIVSKMCWCLGVERGLDPGPTAFAFMSPVQADHISLSQGGFSLAESEKL